MENNELTAELMTALKDINDKFFAITFSEDWKAWELEDQLFFRNAMEVLYGVAAINKEKFDATVWAGHANGTVNTAVQSIRAARTGDKPGRKAEPVTAESILAKRLKK